MRFLYVFTVCLSIFLVSCAPEGQEYPIPKKSTQQAVSAPADGGMGEAEIRSFLQNNPDVVLSILREHPEEVFEIAQQGVQIKQEAARQQQLEEDLANPLQPEIDLTRPVRGPKDAPITIVEYSDFECPYCSKAAVTVEHVRANYGDEVKLLFKHNPLDGHEHAEIAARYFEAAAMQSEEAAWQLYDAIFAEQKMLGEGGEDWLKSKASMLDLNMAQLAADIHSAEVDAILAKDMAEVEKFGIRGTPHFLVNGVTIAGAVPVDAFQNVIEKVRAKALSEETTSGGVESSDSTSTTPPVSDQANVEGESCVECVTKD